jgi:hypothetical protein
VASRFRAAGLAALALVLLGVALAVPPVPAPPAPPPSASPGVSASPPSSASTLPSPAPVEDAIDDYDLDALTIPEQREAMLKKMLRALSLDDGALQRVRAIISSSDWMSQGNPKISRHAMTRAECREKRRKAARLAEPSPRCQAANMVPLTPLAENEGKSVLTCIDQYEFPNVVCEYPVTWVRADEASDICHALGKRLCDAHEWEGACAGVVKPPNEEYAFGQRRVMMEHLHNESRDIVWAYGREQNHALCATSSKKSPKCYTPTFGLCGTNTFPAGAFPECVSALGVYDQHGNAAEHMNLPMKPEELGARGGTGETEMKGSWFIFKESPAHQDDCRFRAPGWHASKITDKNSHRNYHLGFRCCRDVPPG